MKAKKNIYIFSLLTVLLLICSITQITKAQTVQQDIQKYEAERKRNEEIAKLNADAKKFIDRKMEETFKRCSDGFRYILVPLQVPGDIKRNEDDVDLLRFKDLALTIMPIRVLDKPTKLESDNNIEVKWTGKVETTPSVSYKMYNEQKREWDALYQKYYKTVIASVSKMKGKEWEFEFNENFKSVDCELVNISSDKVIEAIFPNRAKADAIVASLTKQWFTKCDDGFWYQTKGVGSMPFSNEYWNVKYYQVRGLNWELTRLPSVYGRGIEFSVKRLVDSSQEYVCKVDEAKGIITNNCNWKQIGKEDTINSLNSVSDKYFKDGIFKIGKSNSGNSWYLSFRDYQGEFEKPTEITDEILRKPNPNPTKCGEIPK